MVSNETRTVVFQNVTSGIVIEKLDRVTSAPLPNARFQVTRNSDNIVIGEYVTDEDGLALVGGLTPGMYTVEELSLIHILSFSKTSLNTQLSFKR